MDNIDTDFALQKYSNLMNNDPRMIRSPQAVEKIRKARQEQAEAQQQAAQAEQAQKLAAGAKNLSETDLGGGKNALQQMMGI
jgi:Xaa-Pro aminopeptidase